MKAVWNKTISDEMNRTLAFVFEYTPDKSDELHIAASSLYRLMINGRLIGCGPARAAHGQCRLDKYSLADFAGKNARIVCEVYAAGINSYYTVKESPFFAAEIHSGEALIAEASDFDAYEMTDRVIKSRRFNFQRSFAESYVMKRPRTGFYTGEDKDLFPSIAVSEAQMNTLLPRNVSYPALDSIPFIRHAGYGTFTVSDNPLTAASRVVINKYVSGYEAPDEDIAEDVSKFSYLPSESGTDGLSAGMYTVLDYGRSLSGFSGLKVKVTTPAVIYVTFDEVLDKTVSPFRNDCCNVFKYVLEAGDFNLLSFEANTMRFLQINVVSGEIKLLGADFITYENPDAGHLKFDCKDDTLNAILEAGRHTLAQNAVDVLTDCPSRERAGWLCDSYFSSRAEKLFTGKNTVEKNFLENFLSAPRLPQLPEGMIPMCYPADHYNGVYIPNWSMWFVLELRSYLERTDDRDLTARAKDKVYGLIEFFRHYLNEDGLLENLESWVFIEWSACNDTTHISGVNYPTNMLYAAMLSAAGELYGDETLIRQSADMKNTIRRQAFNGEFFDDNAVRGEDGSLVLQNHITETCQYYAFYFETADKQRYPDLYNKMLRQFGPERDISTVYPDVARSNAIVGNYLRLELLLRDRKYSDVLSECKAFFGKMAELTGTLWENSDEYASLNHGFASVAANYIVEAVENGERTTE